MHAVASHPHPAHRRRVVRVAAPAARRRGVEHLRQLLRLQAQRPPQGEALAHCRHANGQNQVVAHLGGGAGT